MKEKRIRFVISSNLVLQNLLSSPSSAWLGTQQLRSLAAYLFIPRRFVRFLQATLCRNLRIRSSIAYVQRCVVMLERGFAVVLNIEYSPQIHSGPRQHTRI